MSKNKVTFGLKNVHIAFWDTTNETQPAWKQPTKVPGAIGWAPKAEGESDTFYADDGPYFLITSNNGYKGDLTMANVPDEILANMLGWEIDNNSMLVEIADGKPQKFALMGEIQGDSKNRKFVYYDCQASRPEKEANSKTDKTNPDTLKLNMTVSPIEISGKKVVKGDMELSDANKVAFDSFFEKVYIPVFGTTAA